MDPIHVIYIAGSGRSGTTILDRVLGTLDGVTSFNEVYRIFADGILNNNKCTCGENFNDCLFWSNISAKIFENESPQEIYKLLLQVDRMRHTPRLLAWQHGRQYKDKVERYKNWLNKLYFTLAEQSGSNVLIDSSKVPTRPLLLNDIPGINVYVIHLIRDIRAVAFAWQKEKFNPASGQKLPIFSVSRSVRKWYARQVTTEILGLRIPYIRVLYEDFILNPQRIMQEIINHFEPLSGKSVEFINKNEVALQSGHTIGGNPDRFVNGSTRLQLDFTWYARMKPSTRQMVTLMSYPLLARYGYLGQFSPYRLANKLK